MRKTAVLLASLVLALGAALTPTAAHAAPARANGQANTVIFIHGFGSTSCSSYWSTARSFFSTRWSGSLVTVGYYSGDTNCTKNVTPTGTKNTSIKTNGKNLANWIYSTYSSKGIKVDIVAHSMGGLIARSALTEVAKRTSGYPAYLYVEDVVTLGSPHDGTTAGPAGCVVENNTQCKEMVAASSFLQGLAMRPLSAMGTDWTNIGSWGDGVVTAASATYMNGQHKVQYGAAAGISHGELITTTANNQWGRIANNGSSWSLYADRWGPVQWARNAVYYSSTY